MRVRVADMSVSQFVDDNARLELAFYVLMRIQ